MREIRLEDATGQLRDDAYWQVLAHAFYPNCEASIAQAAFLVQHEGNRYKQLGPKYTGSELVKPLVSALEKQTVQMMLCGYVALAMVYMRLTDSRIGVRSAAEAVAMLRPESGHFLASLEAADGSVKKKPVSSDVDKIRKAFRRYRSAAHIHAARLVCHHYLEPRSLLDYVPELDLMMVKTAAMLQKPLLQCPQSDGWDLWRIAGADPGQLMDDYPAVDPPFEMVQPFIRP